MTERSANLAGRADGVGVVVIGRNEGERLMRCLRSVGGGGRCVVYVDSGSSDGSPARARAAGVEVVDLDTSLPFTAARARNAGFAHLIGCVPLLEVVQFVDGDCEVEAEWIPQARAYLAADLTAGVVFGRRRERYPERSVYNLLCDLEWRVPAGEVRACGGDAMFRVSALLRSGGYRADLIAGEEPELCVRLRAEGWRIISLDIPMTLHDAGMTRFAQWWLRTKRCGYAFAAGAHLHGRPPERHWVRETRRALGWGAGLPLVAGLGFVALGPIGLVPLLAFPAQMLRLYLQRRKTSAHAFVMSGFHVLGRIPEAIGAMQFYLDGFRRRRGGLIEYK